MRKLKGRELYREHRQININVFFVFIYCLLWKYETSNIQRVESIVQ